MKKLIKITGVLMLMMVMVLTMAGCGGNSSEEAPAEEPAETEQAEEPAAEPIGIHHAEIVGRISGDRQLGHHVRVDLIHGLGDDLALKRFCRASVRV